MASSSNNQSIPDRVASPIASIVEEKTVGKGMKIVLFEKIDPSVGIFFRERGFEVEEIPRGMVDDELIKTIKGASMIGIRSKTKVTEKVLLACRDSLIAVGCFCIGTNQVNLDVAKELGIVVFNSPFENTRSVAELMICEMICLSRFIGDRSSEMHRKIWGKTSKNCHEIRGKSVGIVGYGHIGSQLSVLAEAMGLKVFFYDVIRKMPLGNSVRLETLEELLSTVDFVCLHVPATPTTNKMIGKKQLALMKKGSYILNASRGSVVILEDLADAIKSGHIRGAALDVYPVEPRSNTDDFECVLQGLPNVILTPHTGGSTEEAQKNIGGDVRLKLLKYVVSGKTQGSVNFPELNSPLDYPSTKRITNIHENKPGVLKQINSVLSDFNISSQALRTSGKIGYIIVDVDSHVSEKIFQAIYDMPTSIRTRLINQQK